MTSGPWPQSVALAWMSVAGTGQVWYLIHLVDKIETGRAGVDRGLISQGSGVVSNMCVTMNGCAAALPAKWGFVSGVLGSTRSEANDYSLRKMSEKGRS